MSESTRKYRILIADDNVLNQELLEAYLVGKDYEIEFAKDGLEAIEKVSSFCPDLLLLDVMMPRLSGFEVCETVKKQPESRRTMVLMVTALSELGDIERAVAAGCDDYLSKPVNKVELLKRVETMLRYKDIDDENERLRKYIDSMEETLGSESFTKKTSNA